MIIFYCIEHASMAISPLLACCQFVVSHVQCSSIQYNTIQYNTVFVGTLPQPLSNLLHCTMFLFFNIIKKYIFDYYFKKNSFLFLFFFLFFFVVVFTKSNICGGNICDVIILQPSNYFSV